MTLAGGLIVLLVVIVVGDFYVALHENRPVDENDCTDGKVAGALIGGGAGAAIPVRRHNTHIHHSSKSTSPSHLPHPHHL